MKNKCLLKLLVGCLLVLGIVLLHQPNAKAGVWPKGKGKGYIQLGGTSKSWSGRFQGDYSNTIRRELWRNVRETNISIYGEYGISDRLTLIANIPYVMLHSSEDSNILMAADNPFDTALPAGKLNGLGNVSVALQYPILQKGMVVTAQGKITTATASFDSTSGLRTGYDAWGLGLSGMAGTAFKRSYLTFELGGEVRSNKYSPNIITNFEYGFTPNNSTYIIGTLSGVYSFSSGTYNNSTSEQTATYLDNQGYLSYGIKIYQKIGNHFSVNVMAASGRAVVNQGTQPSGIYGGIAYEW